MLLELTHDWRAQWPGAAVHLAGMVGSTLGWLDAGYGDCPSPPLATVLEARVANTELLIVGGLRCVNRLGEWDLLRGEGTEVAGWLAGSPSHRAGEQLLVVPAPIRSGSGWRTAW